MKTNWRFTLNLEAKILERDENSFVKDLLSLRQIWYLFPHYYNEDDTISSYGWLIIKTSNKKILDRVQYVKKVYKIEPTYVLEYQWEYHVVFNLHKWVESNLYKRYQKALSFIYWGESIDYHFYYDEWGWDVAMRYKWIESEETVITALSNVYTITQDRKIERELDRHNLEEYNKVLNIPFSEIYEKLWDKECEPFIDIERNIHITSWNQFEYTVDFLQSQTDTFKLFNDEFWLSFIDNEANLEISKEGVLISDGWQFYSNSRWYFMLGKEDAEMQVTDFFIKVHYRLIKSNNEKVFIVSLHNEIADERTEKIEWTNSTNKWPFSDFLQKLGNFHFTGQNPSFIASLHKKICKSPVPDVKYIIWFWFHKEEGIVIFKNGVWDIAEKIFTPLEEGSRYYFNYNGKGYYPSDKMGNSLLETIWVFVPSMWEKKLVELDDTIDFLNTLYADNSGILLLMYVMWVLGNWMFSSKKWFFPILFIRGITWSWKSKFSEILQFIFGTDKPSGFESSSTFTMTMLFTYLIDFPYFITEYRENAKDRQGKTTILMQNYDATWWTKGRPDQTLINYAYRAIPIMDGQEMVTEPALRTRSLQLQFLSKHKIKGNFEMIYHKWKDILRWFMYTYMNLAKWEKYDEYLAEWYELFDSHSNRIRQNMACIYAWCMAMSEKHRDMYIDVINESTKFQNIDYRQNWDDMQIIKAITKFLESDRDNYDSIWDIKPTQEEPVWCIIVSWSKLEEYIKARRIELSLKVDTYISSLENIWYHIGYRDDQAEQRVRSGIIIPYNNIPQEFLIHPKFYNVHKMMKKQEQQKALSF